MAKQAFSRVIRRDETETESTASNASGTVSRPTSNTVTRPTSNTVTRPTTSGTVTRPVSNTVTRPSSSGRGSTETARVDAPVGKGQYIISMEDTTKLNVNYIVTVDDAGSMNEQVNSILFDNRSRNLNANHRYRVMFAEESQQDAFAKACKIKALGVKVRVQKYITIEGVLPALKKGDNLADIGQVDCSYTLLVKSWGDAPDRVKELVLGNVSNPNLVIPLPVSLTYGSSEKKKMMEKAQALLDLGVDLEIKPFATIMLPLA